MKPAVQTPTVSATGSSPRAARPAPRHVEVTRVNAVTPRMIRVTFSGADLDAFALGEPANHLKLFLPREGESAPLLPTFTAQGPIWPEGPRPTVRTYTPRAFRPRDGELDVDFFLHADGPASVWATNVQIGARAGVAGPGRSAYAVDRTAREFVLAGDESALPAISTILESLPSHARVRVLAEVADASDEQELDSAASLQVQWLHRGAKPGGEGRLLAAAIGELDHAPEARYWVACEATEVRNIRRALLGPHGVSPERLVTRGYWKRETQNHPDHDFGLDS